MPHERVVHLPRFALPTLHERCYCPRCRTKISDEDVVAAGARRWKDGPVCFGYQYECPTCRKLYVVTDRLRAFTRPDWWMELAQWHGETVGASDLPNIGPMVLDMIELGTIWIRGGYKGEAGPVMLVYSNSKGRAVEGYLRLEPNSSVSLFDHEAPHGLPLSDLTDFALAVEGTAFELDDQTWTKMSVEEIEKIVHDRVFKVMTDDDPSPRRSISERRGRKVLWPAPNADRSSGPCEGVSGEGERAKFFARKVSVLNCTFGNCDYADGEPASIITLGQMPDGEVNPWVITLRDSKLLVAKLLIVLATNGDELAQRILGQHFANDDAGHFKWPDAPYPNP